MSRSNQGNQSNIKSSPYRLDVVDALTLEKVRSFHFSKGKFWWILTLATLVVAGLTAICFIFTPMRQLIPGYGEIEHNPQFISLHKNVLQLEKTAEAQNRYILSLQRIITQQDQDQNISNDGPSNDISPDPSLGSGLDYTILSEINDKDEAANKSKRIEELYLVPPLKGIESASFLEEKKHLGIDIVAPLNTPIKSILSGYVILSDWTLETGYSIGIQHDYGLVSFYKHNSALLKSTGDYVTAGEAIAVVGNTGEMTSGPHLHFEIWLDGRPMNPADYITFD